MKVFTLIKKEVDDYSKMLRDYPPVVFTLFVLSLVAANIFANKELINYKYLCLDCGTAFSWIMFLCMDVTCRHYGPKATIKLSLLALVINLAVALSFALMASVGGNWGAFYDTADIAANSILNSTFSASPYIVFGSSVAFISSSVVNALLHNFISKKESKRRKSGFALFAFASWVSTFVAQFCDNLIFSLIVSKVLFGWTFTQVIGCSTIQAVAELLCEVVFSPLGYYWCCAWEKNQIGKDYVAVVL